MTPASFLIGTTSLADSLSSERLFNRKMPLEVDVGCGKGRFLLAKASANPDTGYLGIDRQAGRLLKIEKKASRAGLQNVRLLRLEISYILDHLVADQSISAFYVFFPDPWPKRRHHGRRLFSDRFLNAIHRALIPRGTIHVATDHLEYFAAIDQLLDKAPGFERIPPLTLADEEQTDFERIFIAQGKPIGRCSFQKRHFEA